MLRSVVLFLFFVSIAAKEQTVKIPHVEYIIDSLSQQQWDADEASCRSKIFNVLENVKNSTLWATWIWDSIPQSPNGVFYGVRYQLGNYDQCLRPPWLSTNPELRTQYCLADVEMDKAGFKTHELPGPYEKSDEYYVKFTTSFGRFFSYMAYGVCLPAGCQTKSVEKFVRALLSTGHLQAARDAAVSISHCEEAGAPFVYRRAFFVYIYAFAALIFVAVASTYYLSEYPITANQNSFVNHVAKSFCLRRNWATVFKEDKDALTCLHGIRFLTAVIITYIHQTAFLQGNSVSNGIDYEAVAQNIFKALPIIHFDLYVDTFFAMSALLLGKTLSTMDITKPYNLLKNILKRYIRLLGPFAVTVLYVAYASMELDDGPMYPKTAKLEQMACEKTWWLALLMVGNYINTSEMCHPATWYIPCDFHFYVITMVLLYVYRKNPGAGKVAAAVVVGLGFVAPAVSTYIYDLPSLLCIDMGADVNIRKTKNFIFGYIPTHNRMGPYVAGLLVGYLMSVYKPANYKKVWSKTTSFLGATLSLSLMVLVLYLGVLCFRHRVHGILACIFMMFDRTTFAISILGVIIFCTYGDVPLINSFLSWSVFGPLSRLSYGVYVIHILLLIKGKIALRASPRFHLLDSAIECLGLVVLSLMLSMVVWLLVEAPLINFTNRYLNTKSETKKAESIVGVNETARRDKQKVI